MDEPTCSHESCKKRPVARGMCHTHYSAWRKPFKEAGLPLPPLEVKPEIELTCSLCGAGGKITRGMCEMHYQRWWRTGDPLKPDGRRVRRDPEERFLEKVDKNGPVPAHCPEMGPCWMWSGATAGSGYGLFYVGGDTYWTGAHRWSYEFYVKEIPEGYEVDHLCHPGDGSCPGGKSDPHRTCVNPDHLAATTKVANNLRSTSPAAVNARKTHCVNGHEFTDENTYLKPLPRGGVGRECRQCNRDRNPPKGRKPKTHCPQGHEYTPENTYIDRTAGKNGAKRCKTCLRERQQTPEGRAKAARYQRASQERKRAARNAA